MAVMVVYHERDCDRRVLEGRRIAVVGYGSQGRAFALNLRDSGCDVTVLLRSQSASAAKAEKEGCTVRPLSDAPNFHIIILAVPDHEQPAFYQTHFGTDSQSRTFVLLHGSNFHFGNIKFLQNHDVILIAPHGPGNDLRDRYLNGTGLSCFFAIGQDNSGHARADGLAIADSIGSSKAGIYETTFRDETIGDLFGEQTLLVGGLAGLTDMVFRTMIDKGLSPENAYLETIKQLKLLASMIETHGPAGMIERVSKTAAFGSLMTIPSLFDDLFQKRLDAIYYAVESGEFNRLLQQEAKDGFTTYEGLLKIMKQRQSQTTTEGFNKDET